MLLDQDPGRRRCGSAHSPPLRLKTPGEKTMKVIADTLSVESHEKLQLIDISTRVRDWVKETNVHKGLLNLFSLHTTAVLLLNENQDALLEDIREFLKKIVDDRGWYKHNSPEFSDCDRHNATSHLRSLLLHQSLCFQIAGGEIVLGRFQSVFFVELDGPQQRKLQMQVIGE
jgi:secondary thiamine-phosphate synthase enzyme